MKDSSVLFGIPTYLFIITILLLIVTGFVKVLIFHETPAVSAAMPQCVENAGLLLFLKAFSSGCTALTGVEAVSDGIPNFREPAQKNAKRVLYLLAGLVFVIFLGISALCFPISYYTECECDGNRHDRGGCFRKRDSAVLSGAGNDRSLFLQWLQTQPLRIYHYCCPFWQGMDSCQDSLCQGGAV